MSLYWSWQRHKAAKVAVDAMLLSSLGLYSKVGMKSYSRNEIEEGVYNMSKFEYV